MAAQAQAAEGFGHADFAHLHQFLEAVCQEVKDAFLVFVIYDQDAKLHVNGIDVFDDNIEDALFLLPVPVGSIGSAGPGAVRDQVQEGMDLQAVVYVRSAQNVSVFEVKVENELCLGRQVALDQVRPILHHVDGLLEAGHHFCVKITQMAAADDRVDAAVFHCFHDGSDFLDLFTAHAAEAVFFFINKVGGFLPLDEGGDVSGDMDALERAVLRTGMGSRSACRARGSFERAVLWAGPGSCSACGSFFFFCPAGGSFGLFLHLHPEIGGDLNLDLRIPVAEKELRLAALGRAIAVLDYFRFDGKLDPLVPGSPEKLVERRAVQGNGVDDLGTDLVSVISVIAGAAADVCTQGAVSELLLLQGILDETVPGERVLCKKFFTEPDHGFCAEFHFISVFHCFRKIGDFLDLVKARGPDAEGNGGNAVFLILLPFDHRLHLQGKGGKILCIA